MLGEEKGLVIDEVGFFLPVGLHQDAVDVVVPNRILIAIVAELRL